jgi:hypothetical protein
MTFSLLIAINVVADVALLAGLAFVMWQPTRLKPHAAGDEALVIRRTANAGRRSSRRVPDLSPAPSSVA